MMLRRPEAMSRALWGLCTLATISGAMAGLWLRQPNLAPWMSVFYTSRNLVPAAAYAIALFLCFKIKADYPADSRMHLAWRLIQASCAFAVFRYVIDWIAIRWRDSIDPTLISLRQIPIALTLILLTGGLVVMWTSFTAIGLGTRFRRLDLLGIAATAAFVPFVFSLREGMADAHSGYAFIRHIQSLSPILLAAPALAALALHRISHEMGEGTLAHSLRLLAVSLVLRLVSLWIGSSAMGREPFYTALALAINSAASWIFVQAIFQRWCLTVQATSLAERYRRDPEREIAELSRRLVQRT
jgi:type III secretory pathway component EscS